ncbi:MAG: isoleucine--tRNA ligase [Eubacteriales bacterium]|nr:isoleucine--tRNA ligase [Eubacteriales bacterium]MDY3332995.1 isoleucine--tRNA ligase [Gallibacter sp.]
MFKNLSEKPIATLQKEQADKWLDEGLLKKCVETRDEAKPFVFYEGPPTANGKPGIHHLMARTLKDSVCRYKTMQGYRVHRKAGWDTHGLPVEIEVEKQLKMSGKQDIEKYGIKEFNEKCRESVFSYESLWSEMTHRMGYMVDLKNPYITLDNNYIESVWWIINEFFKEGLIYEGYKILPYCPRCGTGLASHEVAQGYKEVKTLTLTAKFKLKDKENEYFLAWTTTPWTIPGNAALAVNPEVVYARAELLSGDSKGDVVILAKELLSAVLGDTEYKIVEEFEGKTLEFIEYEPLMDFVDTQGKKAYYVTCADYVNTSDGTGVVHTAPAFGEDDYKTGRRYDLPVLIHVDEDGKFVGTPWEGKFVMEEGVDVEIIKYLAARGRIFSKHKIEHNYPHCWRCSTPLVYYAKPSWYIEMSKLKDQLVENNNTVNWFPGFVGEKRFGNWLAEVKDWAISRNRYWGTPIPVWRCDCGHLECVGSREELINKSVEDVTMDVELHRPYVDDIHLKCEKCGGTMTRIPEVMDCWFDSGAMPYAQHHYPFENSEIFDEQLFPADFICEGIDQTRGWFYSLMAISTFIKGKAPYKNVLVNDLILDKHGKKMSKSKGNTIDPFLLFDKYGADAPRWYMLQASPAWTPMKFDEDGLVEVVSKFFGTLKNVYNFFVLYSNQDNIDPNKFDVKVEELQELDRWILSRYNSMIKSVEENMEVFDHMKTVRSIQSFLIDDFSNWYIRRARRRFWTEELTADKKAVYKTTYDILIGLTKLIAPFAPFLSDEMYMNLTGEESVHLAYLPNYDDAMIDLKLEDKMELVKKIVGLGRGIREQNNLKVRQPLTEVLVDGKYEVTISDLNDLIEEELNVKNVRYVKELSAYMNYALAPNFKVAGPVLGADIKEFQKQLATLSETDVLNGNSFNLTLNGNEYEIAPDMIDVKITAKDGFAVAMDGGVFAILDTTLNETLVNEGYSRELVSKIQQLRKQNDFEMMDNIEITFTADDEIKNAIELHKEYIMKETLAVEVVYAEVEDKFNINGHDTGIKVVKK